GRHSLQSFPVPGRLQFSTWWNWCLPGARAKDRPLDRPPPARQNGGTLADGRSAAMGDFEFLTIAEASRRIQKRELSPVELTDALLARIEALNPQLDAVVTPTPELARRQARGAEAEIAAGRYRGPLHGIPFGL